MLLQAMKKKEQSYGYRSIRKPQPVKSLRMKDWFSLTTSSPSAEVKPPVWFELPQNINLIQKAIAILIS